MIILMLKHFCDKTDVQFYQNIKFTLSYNISALSVKCNSISIINLVYISISVLSVILFPGSNYIIGFSVTHFNIYHSTKNNLVCQRQCLISLVILLFITVGWLNLLHINYSNHSECKKETVHLQSMVFPSFR